LSNFNGLFWKNQNEPLKNNYVKIDCIKEEDNIAFIDGQNLYR